MARQTVWAAALAMGLLGCSDNKAAECRAATEIVSSFKTQANLLGTVETQNAAALHKASEASQALRKKLDATQLTDDNLIAFRIKAAATFSAVGRLFDEAEKTLTAASQTNELRSGYAGLLQKARDTLTIVCDKKERRRKTARAKKIECKVIQTMIADISAETAAPEALQNTAEGLRNLAVKNKAVRNAVGALADRLEEMKEVKEISRDLRQKLHAYAQKSNQLTAELEGLQTSLAARCSDAS